MSEPDFQTLVIKDHLYMRKHYTLHDYHRIVLLVRSPFDALVAEFHRRTSRDHIGHAPSKASESEG